MLLPILHQLGVTLGVGASTFALIVYVQAMRGGVMNETERRFLRSISRVLRVAMIFVGGVILFSGIYYHSQGAPIQQDPMFLIEATVMGIIIANALLMTSGLMSMWVGPSIAGGSWYSLFFLHSLPFDGLSFSTLLTYYGLFVAVFYAIYTILKHFFRTPDVELYLLPKPSELDTQMSFDTEPVEIVETVVIMDMELDPKTEFLGNVVSESPTSTVDGATKNTEGPTGAK